MLEFDEVSVSKIGGTAALRDRQWANLAVILQDTDTRHRRLVSVDVLLPKRPDVTMSELEEAARSEAVAILEVALESLKGSTVAELTAQRDTRGD